MVRLSQLVLASLEKRKVNLILFCPFKEEVSVLKDEVLSE